MTAREKIIEAMARAFWKASGDPRWDELRDGPYRQAYFSYFAAALTAIAEQGYAVVPRISDCDPAAIYQNYLSQNDVARS